MLVLGLAHIYFFIAMLRSSLGANCSMSMRKQGFCGLFGVEYSNTRFFSGPLSHLFYSGIRLLIIFVGLGWQEPLLGFRFKKAEKLISDGGQLVLLAVILLSH